MTMNKQELKTALQALLLYTQEDIPALRPLTGLLCAGSPEQAQVRYAELFRTLLESDGVTSLAGYLTSCILYSENPFSRAAARGEPIPDYLRQAVAHDLAALENICMLTPELLDLPAEIPFFSRGDGRPPLGASGWAHKTAELERYHRENGCGIFARYHAFLWRDGKIQPVQSTNTITLADLKTYEPQRRQVLDNTLAFLAGLPANNVLLYGDRGTGKSSTVHAILNEYAGEGLRMIEMPKSAIPEFPTLVNRLSESPMKFIVFIDDLSFDANDDSYAALKAALEGGLTARRQNLLIYATSNLRHLVRERFSDREGDELHRGDTMQEQLSLSDRFGLFVTFINPDRRQFYEILDGIAADRGLPVNPEQLHTGAERWALARGGRSPRTARQYIDYIQSRIERGMDWA